MKKRIAKTEAQKACEQYLIRHGASKDHARATAVSIMQAEMEGNHTVGLAHLIDYGCALDEGRADGDARPDLELNGNIIRVDAQKGFPHLGVECAWQDLVDVSKSTGVAILALRNGFTCGALGYFARKLADEHGLAALVAANAGPAIMPASGGSKPVFCTNPLAFAMPSADQGSIVIDQSSAEGALVGIHQAKAAGREIPEGWAIDDQGQPTTDPNKALQGSLLPFGGYRGANIALMVELLAAGLTGGNWAHAAAPFNQGDRCPSVGLMIIAIAPKTAGGIETDNRVSQLVQLIQQEADTHIPGLSKSDRIRRLARDGLQIDEALWRRIVSET